MREFGSIISENRLLNGELSTDQRLSIITLRNQGISVPKIAREFRCSIRTIYNTLQRATEHNTTQSRPRKGRPSKLTDRDKRAIYRYIQKQPRVSYTKLKKELGLIISISTLKRALREENLRKWLAKERPKLTKRDAQVRYNWALAHRSWTVNNWRRVIFSDECSVERGTGSRRTWVFRRPGERWKKEKVDTFTKGQDISFMVWGGIYAGGKRSKLYLMERGEKGGYNRFSYIKALEEELLLLYEPGMIFQQDNAPIHMAAEVKHWFESHGIWVLNWPPYSPDLNPIEHVWAALKQLILKQHPECLITGRSDSAKEAFYQAIMEAWDSLESTLISSLIDSMPHRVAAVLQSNGWQTHY